MKESNQTLKMVLSCAVAWNCIGLLYGMAFMSSIPGMWLLLTAVMIPVIAKTFVSSLETSAKIAGWKGDIKEG